MPNKRLKLASGGLLELEQGGFLLLEEEVIILVAYLIREALAFPVMAVAMASASLLFGTAASSFRIKNPTIGDCMVPQSLVTTPSLVVRSAQSMPIYSVKKVQVYQLHDAAGIE